MPVFPRTILLWLKVLSWGQLKALMTAEDAIGAQRTDDCWRRALLWLPLASRDCLVCVPIQGTRLSRTGECWRRALL